MLRYVISGRYRTYDYEKAGKGASIYQESGVCPRS